MARLFNEPEHIKMDPQMIIEADFVDREYVIIMPINNLELNQQIDVLDVTFTNTLNPEEANMIKSSQTFKIDEDWSNELPKAKAKIRADNFYDAIMNGYKKILTVMKYISFRNDLSFVHYQDKKMQFKNSLFYSRLDPIMKVFCKESESNHSMFSDLRPWDRTIWKSLEMSDEYFLLLKDVEKSIVNNTTQTDQQNPIFLSIQSLADSIQADDPITSLSICIKE